MKIIIFLFLLVYSLFSSQRRLVEEIPGRVFKFNYSEFENLISRQISRDKISGIKVVFPVEGVDTFFILRENDLFESRIPGILTFDGISQDGKSSLKLSLYDHKLNAIVKTPSGYYTIEPYKTKDGELRIYNAATEFDNKFDCYAGYNETSESIKKSLNSGKLSVVNFPLGSQIRKFRFAAAATAEFTQLAGGQDAAVAELAIMVNLINKIFESELSVSFTMVQETINKSIIFTDSSIDPFPTVSSPDAGNSQAAFNSMNASGLLPYANYDMGHTFHLITGSGAAGEAGGQPCSNTSKALAWSSYSLSVPKSFAINIIVHEIGHQFSAWHSYNAVGGSSAGSTFCTQGWDSSSAVEPGSGITLQSYPTNCNYPNDQRNLGDRGIYFHAKSLDQMLATIANISCYTLQSSNNIPPAANAGVDITVPKSTPFVLRGLANDSDNTNLSYTWEQVDVATASDKGAFGATIAGAGGYTAVNSITAPLFKSEQSVYTTERYFPKTKFVLNNQNNPPTREAEALPMVARNMKFRFTVRDNNPGNGGVDSDDINVNVSNDGPLKVTYPNAAGVTLTAGTNVTILWDVNSTNNLKDKVNILLSLDGGSTFPIELGKNVDNSGVFTTSISNYPNTSTARIKIVGVINPYAEFYDISDNNFTLVSGCGAYSSYINPDLNITALQGSPATNLNMTAPPAAGNPYTTKTFTYNQPSIDNGIIVYSNSNLVTPVVSESSYPTHTFSFRVTKSGMYVFKQNNGLIISIHTGFPATLTTFIVSNSYGTLSYGINTSTTPILLNAGTDYYFVGADYSDPASSDIYSFNVDGPGMMYETITTPSGFNYTFGAFNNSTGKITMLSSTANFTGLVPGSYTVKGISYSTAISDPSIFLGQTINEIRGSGYCLNESSNFRSLTITGTLAVQDLKTKTELIITPNPATDFIKVINGKTIEYYEIYDTSGRKIKLGEYEGEINCRELTPGGYILILYSPDRIYNKTFIKK